MRTSKYRAQIVILTCILEIVVIFVPLRFARASNQLDQLHQQQIKLATFVHNSAGKGNATGKTTLYGLTWLQAVKVLGAMRVADASKIIVPDYFIFNGISPSHSAGFSDLPVGQALAEIGLPSASPLLHEVIKYKHVGMFPASILTAIMPADAATAFVDAFEHRHASELTVTQRQCLNELKDAIPITVHNGRPRILPLDDALQNYHLIIRRQHMINAAIKVVRQRQDWDLLPSKIREAIDQLGELRSIKAAALLGPYLLVPDPERPDSVHLLDRYPVAPALAKIGLPAVQPLLHQIVLGDQPDQTLRVVTATLVKMMPPRVAVTFVNHAIAKEQNQLAKERLEQLKHDLENAEPQSAPQTPHG